MNETRSASEAAIGAAVVTDDPSFAADASGSLEGSRRPDLSEETLDETAHSIEGSVDYVGPERVYGWVKLAGSDSTRIDVSVCCNGVVLCSATSDGFREDVKKAGIGDGYYGFNFTFAPGELMPGSVATILARVPGARTRRVFYEEALPAGDSPAIASHEAPESADISARSAAGQPPGTAKVMPTADRELVDTVKQDAPGTGVKLNAAALRAAGERAYVAGQWSEAARLYRSYLLRIPGDTTLWLRLGECFRGTADLEGAEEAYRAALTEIPDDADLQLHLGHILKLRGRHDDAIEAYKRSFALKPQRVALTELRALGAKFDTCRHDAGVEIRTPNTFLEITDLLAMMTERETVYGIQRVQLGLLSFVLGHENAKAMSRYGFVVWHDDELWIVSRSALADVVAHYHGHDRGALAERRRMLLALEGQSILLRPIRGDVVIITGMMWQRDNIAVGHERLKRSGVRLGACIYDFLSLSHPEFFHPWLTERFSVAISETLLHLDFALTISDYVGKELRRLLTAGGFPPIPVRAIPLAHDFRTGVVAPSKGSDEWTWPIAALRGMEFVLSVGSVHAHKNQIHLVHAWRALQKQGIIPPILVIVGERGYGVEDMFRLLDETGYLDGRVMVIEGLSDEEIATLYDNCLFTMFPSMAEGWGLPVGESLVHGKLCIASKTTSLPEVGGQFVLYIDPSDADATAGVVRRLLSDHSELNSREAEIRANFRARTWQEYGEAFLRAADRIGRASPKASASIPLTLSAGHVLRPCATPFAWVYGTALPPYKQLSDMVLRRLVLVSGWRHPEPWGTWIDGASARLSFTAQSAPGNTIRLALQMRGTHVAAGLRVLARPNDGNVATATVPKDPTSDFLLCVDCRVGEASRVDVTLEIAGTSAASGGLPRVGLVKMLYLLVDEAADRIAPNQLLRTWTTTGWSGSTQLLRSAGELAADLRRRVILSAGWRGMEPWGAWMDGPVADLRFVVVAKPGEKIRVALQLRSGPGSRGAMVTARASCGASATAPIPSDGWHSFLLWLDCKVARDSRLHITLGISGGSLAADCVARLGICGLACGQQDTSTGWQNLSEALLFPAPATAMTDIPAELREQVHFTVTGHVNGSYSLASVNRRLALALDLVCPGNVRLEQVEGRPLQDHSDLPPNQRSHIKELAARPARDGGVEIVISQHYPLWIPPRPGDLPLAILFWEESQVPRDIVERINSGFRGVLAPAQSVARALIDSGVMVPVRVVGFAPDLDAFAAVGAWRSTSRARRKVSNSAPFVLLHVSSCFPRKGVDMLLAAYAKAFRSTDPVRLVIKGFPNPHNDAEEQIAKLRSADPGLGDIEFINRDLPTKAMLDLYANADAMILPTRGEGFNIPAAEALAAGVPLVVTNFGAQADFTGPDIARMLDFRFSPSLSHLKSPGSVWVDPDLDDLADAMREVFEASEHVRSAKDLSERVERGREIAASLGNARAWANRVVDAALDLLALEPPAPPKVAWVTTWKVRCGIAEYSRLLLSCYPDAASNVTVLCDQRTQAADVAAGGGPKVRIAWRLWDSTSIEALAGEIGSTTASVVVIQHHLALVAWPALASLLADPRVAGRKTVVMLHNVHDFENASDAERKRVIAALASATRLLVHTIRDLNILKSHGLIHNVALFPHGAEKPEIAAREPRRLTPFDSPLIGSYGFFLPHKGYDILIRAFKLIREKFRKARLRLVAAQYPAPESAEELARCRASAAALGLTDAIEWITDFLPQHKSLELLNECDVIALPYQNTNESSSAAVRVAIASRTPVMVTSLHIFDDVEDAVLRFDGTDAASVAGGVNWLLNEDPTHRKVLQTRVEEWLTANDWTVVAGRMCGMLTGLAVAGGQSDDMLMSIDAEPQ